MSAYEKLQKVQLKLTASKNKENEYGGFKYRSAEQILENLKPLLKEFGALNLLFDELVLIGDRYYIKATAQFIDVENGDKVVSVAYAREELNKKGMDASQVTGSASSYARKYAMAGLYAIDNEKDADTMDNRDVEEEKDGKKDGKRNTKKSEVIDVEVKEVAPKEVVDELLSLLTKDEVAKSLVFYKIQKIEDISKIDAVKLIARKKAQSGH